jgi:cation:H+ antiporter
MFSIGGFLICAIVIFFAGRKLSWYGDKIAEKTGLGKAWVGLILLATVTSLPELVVGISSSAIVQSADLAVGDILGSCAFNLAILAALDIFVPRHQHLFYIASGRHILSAALGTVLVAFAGLGIWLPQELVLLPGIGVFSLAFVIIYLLSIRVIYQREMMDREIEKNNLQVEQLPSMRRLVTGYFAYACITVGAALFIPQFAEEIVEQTGMAASFMGTVFIAGSTSLPEIAVSIAAVRMGAIDLATGNLLGSNIFNILILVIDDILYTKGVLLKDASDNHLVTVFSCIAMSAIVVAGFAYRAPAKKYFIAIDAVLILLLYFLNILLLSYMV